MMTDTFDFSDGLSIGSLCTGYGGLDMGTLAAFGGGSIAWTAETDSHMSTLLQRRIPSLKNLGDVNSVNWDSVPRVNILTAGFPCQDISAAGKREGIKKGNRSGLFYRVMEAVRVLRPDYVVLENVAALRWKNGGLGEVLAHLAEAGYDVFWTSIRASDIGAPHRRERIFILAHPCNRFAETFTHRLDARVRSFPTPDVSDATRTGCDPRRRKETGRQVNLRDIATLFPAIHAHLDSGTSRSLPTPTTSEATKGSPNSRDSKGNPGLTAAVIELLPTPLAGGNRKSRPAIVRRRSGPGLEQAIEMVLGMMPTELTSWAEAPGSWTGVSTRPRSDGGN